jgi:hypothetical protein
MENIVGSMNEPSMDMEDDAKRHEIQQRMLKHWCMMHPGFGAMVEKGINGHASLQPGDVFEKILFWESAVAPLDHLPAYGGKSHFIFALPRCIALTHCPCLADGQHYCPDLIPRCGIR